MTHGCLVVRAHGETRKIVLHTYHTGQSIPDAVSRSIEFHVRNRYQHMARIWRRHRRSRGAFEEELADAAFVDGYDYAPTVAGWIIAATPNLLHPVAPAFYKDLPSWSGLNHPYKLLVGGCWKLFNQECDLVWEESSVYARSVEEAWRMIHEEKP